MTVAGVLPGNECRLVTTAHTLRVPTRLGCLLRRRERRGGRDLLAHLHRLLAVQAHVTPHDPAAGSALIGLPFDLLGRGEERPDRALQRDRDRLVVLLQAAPEQLGARRELEDLAGRGLLAGGGGVELSFRRVGGAGGPRR